MVYKIKDRDGRDFEIRDLKKFSEHIFKFHSNGNSIHEEYGFFFIIDDRFRKKLKMFLNMNNHKKK